MLFIYNIPHQKNSFTELFRSPEVNLILIKVRDFDFHLCFLATTHKLQRSFFVYLSYETIIFIDDNALKLDVKSELRCDLFCFKYHTMNDLDVVFIL
jgi:hypothetical protein